MLYILALIIILYTSSHFLFRKKETYLKVRKYIDIATILVTSILVIAWVEVFKLSFLIIIYFFTSLGMMSYLIYRLRKTEIKKLKAEEVIKTLKTEEKVLENEIESLQK
ncbi:hypothetical protein A2130_03290 [Candidatus Woesebacteria bacterium GWC2_33_12]|uniref:Uncharacterized protein n=1 Tax=Candidatus Woesebacteria bacterium GW2011_GWB1_33_22 TaxID=1618566 RepID=A0A0G0CM62_9BACT|nr:MAG: hypothetical protein UR29_C0004G0023 [Candidatus Woesebacteria bacterium GW2011_GWC2_33_12]KKP41903.1 MAG: hypothetical protein UR33_C0008G0022 [Candidatus Woesebacteria bacterium GW2011_GWA2_33_20]KKP44477.1 MAG: hypothetical protein UR35_C0008G0022 [Candidatus Woesebacteria bacterium GW2011_GWB1_33_22]KKP46327.1 MAG: hypothetical protein UR37_C0009G0022 [Microgenomates group bacterium GW2011_GWC1_33_28]KKP50424.1 MAG: hypothetical protein UR41_C0008G0022 [Candidatus Woesebacteria bact